LAKTERQQKKVANNIILNFIIGMIPRLIITYI
jgi:hypothetical protein